MRSLDEVIQATERCWKGPQECNTCSYKDDLREGNCCATRALDALNHLKMYRSDRLQYEADRKHWQEEMTQVMDQYNSARDKHIKALAELKQNDPLTWDELLRMEGKPVWLERYDPIDNTRGWISGTWMLIEFINNDYFDARNSDGEQYDFVKGDDTWQAYRKERK
jgi:hypothetical protein